MSEHPHPKHPPRILRNPTPNEIAAVEAAGKRLVEVEDDEGRAYRVVGEDATLTIGGVEIPVKVARRGPRGG